MKDELKEGIRSFLKVNNIDNLNVADLIDEYESEQIFTELKDGSFEIQLKSLCCGYMRN